MQGFVLGNVFEKIVRRVDTDVPGIVTGAGGLFVPADPFSSTLSSRLDPGIVALGACGSMAGLPG